MMIRTAIEIQDNEAIGNKAKSLIELARAGFTVPRTWILPAQVYTEARSGTDPLKNFDWNAWYSAAGHVRLAVRSSCTVEDSNAASFAGLFESYLDIQSAERLREAVYACWNSSESERVRRYAETKGIDLTGLAMSVVIQDYIEPDFAGVAFTLNPMTGDDREMLFEAVEGCGDKLVAGLVTPARYRLSWFADEPLISAHGPLANVTPENLKVLRSALRKVQALKGRPQDVEFAFKHGKLYLLQSRDITRVQIGTEMGEWTTADLRDGGVSATVTTPLMWSFYRMCIQESMSEYFAQLKLFNPRKRPAKFAEVFYGRPYWNLGFVKEIMTAVPGFVERNFDEDLSVQPTYEGDGVTTPLTPLGLVRAIPTVLALGRSFKEQLHIDELVLAQSRSLENFYRAADLTKLTDGRLAKVFTYLCETEYPFVEKNYFKTIYNTSNAKLEFKVSLEKLAKIDPELRYNELMAGLDQLDVIQPVHELWKLRDLVGAN
ncbi:MAG: PEP/pyruvate-binding domain-containing protein, partial [Bdellovibrionia bacterium]